MEMYATLRSIKAAKRSVEIGADAISHKTLQNYLVHVGHGRPILYIPVLLLLLCASRIESPHFLVLTVTAQAAVLFAQTICAQKLTKNLAAGTGPISTHSFTFLCFLSGSLWSAAMLPVSAIIGKDVIATVVCVLLLITVSLTCAVMAAQRRFVIAFLSGFAVFLLPQWIYYRDDNGLIPLAGTITLTLILNWLSLGIRVQARHAIKVQMENEILASQLAEALDAATFLSQRDSLTGLLNRRAFEDAAIMVKEMGSQGEIHAIILIDLDHFKSINDAHGHAVGDAVLQGVATLIMQSVGPLDLVGRGDGTVARWGGEEFVILLNNCPTEQAACVAESIRTRLAEHQGQNWPDELAVTGSFGVAPWPSQNSLQSAISNADQAMYAAKRSGRNQTRIYSATS